jgi:RNA polymerase sigma factor (sigma-70 family)
MNTLANATDAQLVCAFQSGDNHALEILVNRHKDRIFSSILYMLNDRHLAEDVFQDVFIKIINTLRSSRYNDEGKFLLWALRISHNLCLDHFRKVNRTKSVASDETDIFEMIGSTTDAADVKMAQMQSHHQVRLMLNLLPQDQREVIVLRHYADLSFKEIAELTNCSINTALGRMRYALINLRKIMVEKQLVL